ncbi:MAG: SDR family NAD(P)-dependent oxidoreductase [Rhodothermales bacterium]|nr:SDR family NAD(P)-dependent oxidoreductase [Rhodothermales bacterium]
MKLSSSTFFITGGSSGLGLGTARVFVELGANVILADINEVDGQARSDELGDQAVFAKTDVTSEEDVQAAINKGMDRFGTINGAVNCAGIVLGRKTFGSRGTHDLESFKKVININLVGTFNVTRLAAAAIAENEPGTSGERGVIISTASIAAYDGQIGQAAYSASKGGVVGMTLPIARDLSRTGIRVVTIAPGIMETPMMAGMTDEVRSSLESQVPFPSRLGRPEEYGSLAAHIVENQYINAEVIRLDGAIRMGPK